jgi:hypothetical protein
MIGFEIGDWMIDELAAIRNRQSAIINPIFNHQ